MRITLCGSTKFWEEFQKANRALTRDGHTVYTVLVGKKDNPSEDEKLMLDAVHMSKIANSQAIVVINKDDYIGESTTREIYFAKALGLPIFFTNPDLPNAQEIVQKRNINRCLSEMS